MTSRVASSTRADFGPGRIPGLDGLRGIAILLVLVFHGLDIQVDAIPFAPIHAVAISGWTGVSLFFVLSGFLITGILLDTPRKRGVFRRFYARRALRILPLYYATLFIFFFLLPRDVYPNLAWHDERQFLYWTFLQNWAIAANGGFLPSPNLNHLWSLNIEEQFYLFWPWVVFGLGRRRVLWFCGALIVGCFGLRVLLESHGVPWVVNYVLTITRMDDLAVGGAIACLWRGPKGLTFWILPARILGSVCALCVVSTMVESGGFLLRGEGTNTFGYSVVSLGFGCLLVLVLTMRPDSFFLRRLSGRFLTMFGKYSYGLYVIHLPIVLLMMVPEGKGIDLPGTAGYFLHLSTMIILSLFVAFLSWHILEAPALRLKNRFDEVDTGYATTSFVEED